MSLVSRQIGAALFAVTVLAGSVARAEVVALAEHALGSPNAPITVDEYTSATCSHCADFYVKTLPELEKKYVTTGKVKFISHSFPLNGISLKAAAVANCMPKDQYFPFIKTLYGALIDKTFDSEKSLYQFAALGGLSAEKAKACANDKSMQDAIVAKHIEAVAKYKIEATPTFVINGGEEIINGAQSVEAFSAVFDRLLTAKKK